MQALLAKLRARNNDIQRRDSALSAELEQIRGEVVVDEVAGAAPLPESLMGEGVDPLAVEEESIVMRTGRPVLAVVRDEAQLTIDNPDSAVWSARLTKAKAHLVNAARAVGRIEVEGHSLAWLGTGWLVTPDVIVTNRHVAAEFGRQAGTGFVFRRGLAGGHAASIDLLEEIGRTDEWTFAPGADPAHRGSRWPRPCVLPCRPVRRRPATRADLVVADSRKRRVGSGDRVPGPRQPHPGTASDGPDLRRRVRQEAARAWPTHRCQSRCDYPRLLHARGKLGLGGYCLWPPGRRSACTTQAGSCESNFAVRAAVVARRLHTGAQRHRHRRRGSEGLHRRSCANRSTDRDVDNRTQLTYVVPIRITVK